MSRVILVTGANRGLGRGLVTHYLAQPDTTVIGTVRDVSSENAKDLVTLPKGGGSRLIVVPLIADSASNAAEAVSEIQTQHHIEHIDIVIANAGICTTTAELFRAVAPLLQKASTPKFAYISTLLASIHEIEQIPSLTAAYGMSKVAGNYLIKKIDAENEGLVALAIDPGMVQTDMGSRAAQAHGLEKAPVIVQDTVHGITSQIEAATKATTSGQFVNYNGEKVRW
ncbi:putative NADP(+)-dependent dehydrogenase [Aspergillus novofumigatus IBT 16806]|uniref:Putative NADP(+)-dependent dehydrogenase n=1 Tax=Aspergillus novofumigatus (strain IBT 16806) TaxID=1392255 RepID=A0A2I1BX40_ASPN1|nr:putative NADP(+)-dependent dehydrogenase [Aspergillus novofumigatus IBT 16806]PKX89938.1 putative NADP(+)-dependent dehydrogenase [Aspergillus novofumigatus IBT 16806]